MPIVTILGAGVMGSAMAMPTADRGYSVRLVGTHLDRGIIESVRANSFHPRLSIALRQSVRAHTHDEFASALGYDTDLLVLGVSSAGVDWAIDRLCETLRRPVPVVMITKGMRPQDGTLLTMPDYVAAQIKQRTGFDLPIAAIGGPCIAGELAARRHTGTVIVSRDAAYAERLCKLLTADYYHPRASIDVMGVELCAAFKNFFAIAVGWAVGQLEVQGKGSNGALNFNAASIIFDQAIAEMMALSRHFGGTDASVWGMPGAGDLYVTCQAGRNSRLGRQLGLGLSYADVKAGPMKDDTIEGAELGIAVAETLRKLMTNGKLNPPSLPVTRALLATLTAGVPLVMPWSELHRGL